MGKLPEVLSKVWKPKEMPAQLAKKQVSYQESSLGIRFRNSWGQWDGNDRTSEAVPRLGLYNGASVYQHSVSIHFAAALDFNLIVSVDFF